MAYQFTLRTAAANLGIALVFVLPAHAASVSGQGTWETTLLGRDINRNAVTATDASVVYLYDTTLNVTWLRDANVNGQMTWANANTWAANLSMGSGSLAIDDWRLPIMAPNPAFNLSFDGSTARGYNVPGSSSEMASLFFDTLGNRSIFNTSGSRIADSSLTNTGSFQNIHTDWYWSGTQSMNIPSYAWMFAPGQNGQAVQSKDWTYFALAVRPGDVLISAVPEPETYALMVAGLGLIGAVARRRKSKQT